MENKLDKRFKGKFNQYQDDIEISLELSACIEKAAVELAAQLQQFDEQQDLKMKATEQLAKAIGLSSAVCIPETELSEEDGLDPWEILQQVIKKL